MDLKSIFNDEPRNPVSLQLLGMVDRACDTMLYEPNLALNLDICDFVNQKGLGYPREAAFAILKHVNSRNQTESLHALTLLDQCVKNCGIAFHIVIGAKEFLNDLVKRFPERPGPFPNASQSKVLELIQQWKATLCANPKYKKDLRNIENMYNLLSTKGYRFPGISKDSAAVMKTDQSLKTEEELEAEDRSAMSSKLHELLRVGTPGALEEANEIMKILAGYEPEKKPDYRKQAQDEMEKIRSKIMELNDALNGLKTGEKLDNSASIRDLHNVAKSAQSRIQKLITESDDDEKMETYLQINDLINNTLQKYDDIKAGKTVSKESSSQADSKSVKSPSASSASVPPQQTASLIDFDFSGGPVGSISLEAESGLAGPSKSKNPEAVRSSPMNLLEDLAGLSFCDIPAQTAPSATSKAPYNGAQALLGLTSNAPQMNFFSQPIGMMNGPSQMNKMGMGMGMGQISGMNPIGMGLAGGMGAKVGSNDNLAMFQSAPPAAAQQALQSQKADPFAFINTSSPSSTPLSTDPEIVVLDKSGLKITFKISGSVENKTFVAEFWNALGIPMTNAAFQVAVPKNMNLKMLPLASSTIPPFTKTPITQSMNVSNPNKEQHRIKFKVTFSINGQHVSEQGEWKDSGSVVSPLSAASSIPTPSSQTSTQSQFTDSLI